MNQMSPNQSRLMYLADKAVEYAIPSLREQLHLKANEMPPPELVAAYVHMAAIADLGNAIEETARILGERT